MDYMSLSRIKNWSANSTYLYWKMISLHQLRIIIPKLAKRHSAPIYHRCPENWNLILQLWIVSNSHFFSKEEIVVEHFQDLLAFWPFVSFQEIKLPFPRIKLFLFFRRIVLLNTAIFAASTRGYRRGFKRFQLFNFFPQSCNIHGLWLSLWEFQILICWPEIFFIYSYRVCIFLFALHKKF